MKKLFTMFLGLCLVAGIMSSCKKGANDPFLSLKSRNARITGTWELSSYEYESTYASTSFGCFNNSSKTSSFDGTTITESSTSNDCYGHLNVSSEKYAYSITMEISNDGSYTQTVLKNGKEDISTGYWWWLSNKKNKSGIKFGCCSDNYIDRLKDKEMVWINDSGFSDTDPNNDDFQKNEYSSNHKWTKKK